MPVELKRLVKLLKPSLFPVDHKIYWPWKWWGHKLASGAPFREVSGHHSKKAVCDEACSQALVPHNHSGPEQEFQTPGKGLFAYPLPEISELPYEKGAFCPL